MRVHWASAVKARLVSVSGRTAVPCKWRGAFNKIAILFYKNTSMGSIIKAGIYGALAGAVTALTLWAMKSLEHLVWSGVDTSWQLGAVVLLGGGLIALIRHRMPEASIQQLLDAAHDPVHVQRRWVLAVILTAVVAVAFGGAVGPEAGLIAVVLEIAALIAMRLSRDRAEQRLLGEAAVTASMSAWYGSPPAAADMAQGEDRVPKPLLWWAGLTGLLGFGMTAQHVLGGGLHKLELPAHTPAGDGSDLLWAFLPAVLGVAVGRGFAWLLPQCRAALARLGGPVVQTLVGTLAFACMAMAWPVLRFSGHHDLAQLPEWFQTWGAAGLLALAALKVVALCICLASGWLGGAIFPLLMAGGSAGLVSMALWPSIPAAVALAAGMSAAATVGIGKPWVVILILIFFAGANTLPAVCIGALLAYLALRRWPHQAAH